MPQLLALLHLFEIVHAIAWARAHPDAFRRRVALGARTALVAALVLLGLTVVGSVAIDALGLKGTTYTNASVAVSLFSLVAAALTARWYLRRARRRAEPSP